MKTVLILLTSLFIFSCKSKPARETTSAETFDQARWLAKEGDDYPYRDAMLQDIIGSDTIKKFKRNGVENLLGAPTRADTHFIFYRIAQEKLGGVWPMHTKTLVIKFKNDSSVEWVKIHQ